MRAMLWFYLIVCGAAWYLGGPQAALLAFIAISLLWACSSLSRRRMQREISPAARKRHKQDGSGHIYYQVSGQTIHECDGCAACMAARARELERQGYRVEHVPGRRNSGDLL